MWSFTCFSCGKWRNVASLMELHNFPLLMDIWQKIINNERDKNFSFEWIWKCIQQNDAKRGRCNLCCWMLVWRFSAFRLNQIEKSKFIAFDGNEKQRAIDSMPTNINHMCTHLSLEFTELHNRILSLFSGFKRTSLEEWIENVFIWMNHVLQPLEFTSEPTPPWNLLQKQN